MAKKTKEVQVSIPAPNIQTMVLKLVGDERLVCHKFPEKAKKMILKKQMKEATTGRDVRDPEADYRASLYWLDKDGNEMPCGKDPLKHKTGFGFKTIAFKAAAVRAGKEALGMNMTFTRTAFHIQGEFVRINGTPRMREDTVRLSGGGTTDLRYRAEFPQWSVELPIRFNANAISAEQIYNLFIYAGFGVGVGEYRPERDGNWGMFHVE